MIRNVSANSLAILDLECGALRLVVGHVFSDALNESV